MWLSVDLQAMKMIDELNAKDLKPFFQASIECSELEMLAMLINYFCKRAISIIKAEEKQQAEYENLKKAKRNIENALKSVHLIKDHLPEEFHKEVFGEPIKYKNKKSLLDYASKTNSFKDLCQDILSYIPEEKPKSIKKRAYEDLFEKTHIHCYSIDPNISWYTYNEYSGNYSGTFLEICRLIASKNNFELTDSVITKYLKHTVKPSRDDMQKVMAEMEKIQDSTNLGPLAIASSKTMMDKICNKEVQKSKSIKKLSFI
jgi:hypothetical protein